MTQDRKQLICRLLKGIETGDPGSVSVVNEEKYIQHNPQTHEGSLGLAELFRQLSKTSPRVNIVRVFEDGDFVFAHTEYDFAQRNIGFEIFRFEDQQAVEHWDNIQPRQGPNPSGHSMVDGERELLDHELTEANRSVVQAFVEQVLIKGQLERLELYLNPLDYTEHNPEMTDDVTDLKLRLERSRHAPDSQRDYQTCHRILAEGNFVLAVCEGYTGKSHSSFFDLYRLKDGRIIEHWDTSEAIPPRDQWKNDNGKF